MPGNLDPSAARPGRRAAGAGRGRGRGSWFGSALDSGRSRTLAPCRSISWPGLLDRRHAILAVTMHISFLPIIAVEGPQIFGLPAGILHHLVQVQATFFLTAAFG